MENSSSSSSVSTTNDHRQYLNNLPDLVYYHILKNLDLDNLWMSRLISKRFYYIIKKKYFIKELTFQEYYCYRSDNWFTKTRSPRPEYLLSLSKLDLLSHPSSNLLNLKYLRIKDVKRLPIFRLNSLNKFTKLQILEITPIKLDSTDLLQLPDLKALDICFFDDLKGVSVVVDAPNLHSLAIRKGYLGNELKFNHPLSIKYLRLEHYDENAAKFTNLECLEIYGRLVGLESSDLLKFNNLKSLKNCYFVKVDVNRLNQLIRSKKDELEFVISGVRIKEINKIDECTSLWLGIEFQLNNYGELVDDLWFVNSINYDELLRLLPANQPDDLFTKFTNIQKIEIGSRVEDGSRLIRFIRGCRNLYRLEISGSSLNQQFYNQLTTTKSLFILEIFEDEDLDLDFKFLIKMPYLRELYTDQDVLIDSQLNLNNFKRLVTFKFMIHSKEFEIEKSGRDRYRIDDYKNLGLPDHDYVDHDKLVKWSNQLRCKGEIKTKN